MSQPSFRARYCEKQINDLENIIFIRWANGFSGIHSKAVVQCTTHGSEWSASPNNLFAGRSKCPKCSARQNLSSKQIDSIPNVAFVRWVCPGHVRVRCRIDGFEYERSADELIKAGCTCPVCAESGLAPHQRQTLYVLRSACGALVKIGISNDYEKRHRSLEKQTPFEWYCAAVVHGPKTLVTNVERDLHRSASRVSFSDKFSGFTEWHMWSEYLQLSIDSGVRRIESANARLREWLGG